MATAERPPAKIDGKPNPEYQKWYRQQKKAEKEPKVTVAAGRFRIEASPEKPISFEELHAALGKVPHEPTPLTLRVVKLATNDRFVLCESPTEKGKTVPLRLWKRGVGRKLLRKSVQAELRNGEFHQVR